MDILVVEDEPGLQIGLTDMLEESGHQVRASSTAKEAQKEVEQAVPDLVLLDLGLPDMDGTELLEQFHQQHPDMPILVLTARANESDVVLGFKMGAYDYVTKPFSPRVLKVRIEALLRRVKDTGETKANVRLGDIEIDFERYEATRDGASLHLTTREVEILRVLHQNEGKPVSRNDLLDEVWGMNSEAGPRTVDTHIALLRKKIEPNPDKPCFIISRRGIGYKLVTS